MSLGTRVAGAVCLALTAAIADAQEPIPVPSPSAATAGGLRLDRLSKGHRRIWRAIEEVVAASNGAGEPRSPTLRRLWEWARASPHVLYVEMVSPFGHPAGMSGVFRIERVDPAGRSHVAVIRLCPRIIDRATVGRHADSVLPFVRFEGLTETERYAEVLAHELAHAEYALESPERVARLEAAQNAIWAIAYGRRRSGERTPEDLEQRLAEPLAALAASEAHAESVEAVVLKELAGDRPSPERAASSRP